MLRIFSLIVLGSLLATPAIAQQSTDDNPLMRVLEGVLTQVEPEQVDTPEPPKYPYALCDVSSVTVSVVALVVQCREADDWGIKMFYVPLKAEEGLLDVEMALELAKAALVEPGFALRLRYSTSRIPEKKFCLNSNLASDICRQAVRMTLLPMD